MVLGSFLVKVLFGLLVKKNGKTNCNFGQSSSRSQVDPCRCQVISLKCCVFSHMRTTICSYEPSMRKGKKFSLLSMMSSEGERFAVKRFLSCEGVPVFKAILLQHRY